MSIDIDYLTTAYFTFDLPVQYKTPQGKISIYPVKLKQSGIFLTSCGILTIDKNTIPNPKIIQMSYLQFLYEMMSNGSDQTAKLYKQQLLNILMLCLHCEAPKIMIDGNNKPHIVDKNIDLDINAKQFDEIKKIILYQNIAHYDDSYVNPDLKKAMEEQNQLQNRSLVTPSLERKMAIITAHCGLPKREQEEMTYRSFSLLFEEVCGEVDFTTIRPIALLGKEGRTMEHWIYKKKKSKYEKYTTSVEEYSKSMGGDYGRVKTLHS